MDFCQPLSHNAKSKAALPIKNEWHCLNWFQWKSTLYEKYCDPTHGGGYYYHEPQSAMISYNLFTSCGQEDLGMVRGLLAAQVDSDEPCVRDSCNGDQWSQSCSGTRVVAVVV